MADDLETTGEYFALSALPSHKIVEIRVPVCLNELSRYLFGG